MAVTATTLAQAGAAICAAWTTAGLSQNALATWLEDLRGRTGAQRPDKGDEKRDQS